MKKPLKKIIRNFIAVPEQGVAAMLVGTKAEGLPLKSIIRSKGNQVVATYQK